MQRMLFNSAILAVSLTFLSGCKSASTLGRIVVDTPVHIMQRMEQKAELLEQRRLDAEAVHLAKLAELQGERQYLEKTRRALIAEQVMRQKLQGEEQQSRLQLQEAEGQLELEARRPDFKTKLTSELQIKYGHSLTVGQLEVDIDKLKKLIEKRDAEHKAAMDEWARENNQEPEAGELAKAPAISPVGYEKLADGRDCVRPPLPQDCARPTRQKLMDDQPTKKPVLPTEIPLMLPVNLVMEMDAANLAKPNVQQVPLRKSKRDREKLLDCKPHLNLTDPGKVCCPSCAAPCDTPGFCPNCDQHGTQPPQLLQLPPEPAQESNLIEFTRPIIR